MRNLLEFINKHNNLLLFIFLESFALFLIFQNSQFHKSAFLNSTNSVTANSFTVISNNVHVSAIPNLVCNFAKFSLSI